MSALAAAIVVDARRRLDNARQVADLCHAAAERRWFETIRGDLTDADLTAIAGASERFRLAHLARPPAPTLRRIR